MEDEVQTTEETVRSTPATTNLISAYFAIRFPRFTYYVKTLSCTIGRRSIPTPESPAVHVDIDLGQLKSVSRLHARIEYDEERECFVIFILGRNGAWIDGVWSPSGAKVSLGSKASIQIATRSFQFLMAPSRRVSPTSTLRPTRSPSVEGSGQLPSSPVTESKEPSEPVTSRPDVTMSVLINNAIVALGGRASIPQIRRWIIAQHEWYKENHGWQPSVRETLASDPIFTKTRREKGEKGKDSIYTMAASTSRGPAESQRTSSGSSKSANNSAGLPAAGPLHSNLPRVPHPSHASETSSSADARPPASTAQLVHSAVGSQVTPTPPEDRRTVKRRSRLQTHIQSALDVKAAEGKGKSDENAVVCIPIRVENADGENDAAQAVGAAQQPIVLREGELVLSHRIFAYVSSQQLEMLRRLEIKVVLEILQGELKRFFKEEFRAKKAKDGESTPLSQRVTSSAQAVDDAKQSAPLNIGTSSISVTSLPPAAKQPPDPGGSRGNPASQYSTGSKRQGNDPATGFSTSHEPEAKRRKTATV